jgi:hypothetical protein
MAAFLKKRSAMEDDHAKELKRLCRTTLESLKSRESRQFSYATQMEEVCRVHDRMAENETVFGLNLHQMSVDLDSLAHDMERGRKQWKTTGLAAENRVQEAERALDKAKQKYDSVADDYDMAKTGEKPSNRHLGFRAKSGAALEEDLHRKLNIADQDYQVRVQHAHQLRKDLVSTARPQAVQALLQLIQECDCGVTLQLQKFGMYCLLLAFNNTRPDTHTHRTDKTCSRLQREASTRQRFAHQSTQRRGHLSRRHFSEKPSGHGRIN